MTGALAMGSHSWVGGLGHVAATVVALGVGAQPWVSLDGLQASGAVVLGM